MDGNKDNADIEVTSNHLNKINKKHNKIKEKNNNKKSIIIRAEIIKDNKKN